MPSSPASPPATRPDRPGLPPPERIDPAPLSPTLPSYAPPSPGGPPAPRRKSPNVVPLRPGPDPEPDLVPIRPAAKLLDDTATETAALPLSIERYAALIAMSEHAQVTHENQLLAAFGLPAVDRRRLDVIYSDTLRRRPSLRKRFARALRQWRRMFASKHR